MQEEIWKDIPGYEGYYQVSGLGNVRSLDRVEHCSDDNTRFRKGRVLKPFDRAGYQACCLSANRTQRLHYIHQLVAMTFLGHTPNGHTLVVDHINGKKDDNRLENLQLISQRHNTSKDRKGTSKHTGVSWSSIAKRWKASIRINGKTVHLGYFTDESEAALTYQNALKEHLTSKKT
jgi:hypothetical protein